jgi:uncharacterized membrane protein YfcA
VFFIAVFIVAILSGATATVVGFGIGSLMTPLLAIKVRHHHCRGTRDVAARAAATAVRCWRWRAHVDRTVLVRFGLLSAAGCAGGRPDLHATRPGRFVAIFHASAQGRGSLAYQAI